MEQRKRVYYDLKQKLLYNLFDVWCINKIRIFFIFEEKDIVCCKLLSLYKKVLLVFLLYLIIESNVMVCDSLIIVFLIISVGKN